MTIWETEQQLKAESAVISEWEKEQKDLWFWEKLGRLPFLLLDRLTPKFVHQKLGAAIDELGSYLQTGGRYLVSERSVLERLDQEVRGKGIDVPRILTVKDVSGLPLAAMNSVAEQLSDSRTKLATVQGATTGFGGIFTLAIDIPALLGLSLKILQEIAITYGYDPNDPRERIFIVKCLQFSSSDIVGKRALLEELARFEDGPDNGLTVSQLQGWREVIATYRDNFGWKKLFQMVPVAGMLFGALLNRSAMQDVAEAGRMLYRKRRVLSRL